MYEPGVSGRQGDRDTGANHGPFTGLDSDVRGGHEVGAGIAMSRVARQRDILVDPRQRYLQRVSHERRDYR